MEIDKTTLTDLSILDVEDEFSVFSKINLCRTVGGREKMYENFTRPLQSIEAIMPAGIVSGTRYPEMFMNALNQ